MTSVTDDQERAAAYIRVSTQQQKDEDSHVRQEERIRQWADEQGVDELDVYRDIAVSGQADNREDHETLMRRYRWYDYVVVRELSRFGRDPVDTLGYVEEIGETDGTEFVSVTEPMLDTTSAHGKLMVRLIASINGFYADLRREQAQRMAERRKEQGLPVGRPTKLDDSQMEEVFEWREKGLSYSHIATLVEEVHGVDVSRQTIYRYCQDAGVDKDGVTADD